jgi:hypothetical protein
VALVAATITLASVQAVGADALSEDFEAFAIGSPNGQNGWQFTGAYDAAIVDPFTSFGVLGMGDRAFRISNATTSGSFGDWVFSKSLTDDAGESGAVSDGLSGGTRQSHFEASFKITSAVPSEVQPGLQFSLAPDRGDGARMSFLRFNDTSGGIEVTFADYLDKHPQGPPNSVGCGSEDDFFGRKIATGLSRSAIHDVKITMDFLPGPANDRVEVFIDGVLSGTGTSWEDYFRYCEGNPTRPVDSLIFQARDGAGTALGTLGNGFLIDDLSLSSGPIPAVAATGAWEQYPTGTTEYQAAVQQPINTANTSNWSSKSKGAIPVMFKLSSRTGPAAFESIGSDANTANDYAYMSFTPDSTLTFDDITELRTDYAFTLGDCHGGSLRWQVRTSPTQAVFIYYGTPPAFGNGEVGGCTPGSTPSLDQSGVNMIGQSDARYDLTQLGGPFYGTYAQAVGLLGSTPIIRASLVIDSGWQDAPNGDQRLDVSNTTVNGNVYQFVVSTAGSFMPTCNLPTATIQVGNSDPVVDGALNEEPVQSSLADSGNRFRVVDCKYQYILSIPSLAGTGTYYVEIKIGGVTVPTPSSPGGKVKFDLK